MLKKPTHTNTPKRSGGAFSKKVAVKATHLTVNYDVLDKAKNAFIAASKKTLKFAAKYGFIPGEKFGASANVFALDLKPYLQTKAEQLYVTLLPEGLGTADDARPDDLTQEETVRFWYNIGLKTVSVLTNDAASAGMQTVLISLYLPSSTPEIVFNKTFMEGFLNGFVEGCRTVQCVYFSGETPQLENKIVPGALDVAGALFGVMPPGQMPVDSKNLRAGDQIVLIESSGPHENGFTTLRSLASKLPQGYRTKLPSGSEYWEAINMPAHLYTPLIQDLLLHGVTLSNIEPITGHGWQKLMRPQKNFRYKIEKMLSVPEVFQFVEKAGGFTPEQMVKIFNYGAGLALYTHTKEDAQKIIKIAEQKNLKAVVAGVVEDAPVREVVIEPLNIVLKGEGFALGK